MKERKTKMPKARFNDRKIVRFDRSNLYMTLHMQLYAVVLPASMYDSIPLRLCPVSSTFLTSSQNCAFNLNHFFSSSELR